MRSKGEICQASKFLRDYKILTGDRGNVSSIYTDDNNQCKSTHGHKLANHQLHNMAAPTTPNNPAADNTKITHSRTQVKVTHSHPSIINLVLITILIPYHVIINPFCFR